ncbi:PILR alpha-associated neural protein [Aplochiton taeniatus]
MERCSLSPVKRLSALRCLVLLLLVALATRPSTCNRDDRGEKDGQVEALSAQLSVTAKATPTLEWAVDWGPTRALEDETHHFLSSQETDHLQHQSAAAATTTTEAWPHHQSAPGSTESLELPLEAGDREVAKDQEREPEEVDPQFYVTVTISSLLILAAVIITAKLCYDRSCSQQPPPLSRGAAPPLSLALPRSLASEDSRQTLHSTPSFTDRERIPVVNL